MIGLNRVMQMPFSNCILVMKEDGLGEGYATATTLWLSFFFSFELLVQSLLSNLHYES
ncbi:MAG: hypothetical protein K9G76_03255 [Bacteroidales bacterium]|nr:hypothetical protein [Bacteroidales bacterium]MCF8402810.1 hypothetical protein [Bacteroidales bacterium]